MVDRKLVEFEWDGNQYEVVPGPALLRRIERRPDGIPIVEITNSQRFSDHGWVIYSALREVGVKVTLDEVLQAVMDDINAWTDVSIKILLEMLVPAGSALADSDGIDDVKPDETDDTEGNSQRPMTGELT